MFMEPDTRISVPCSQELATFSDHESHESDPLPPTPFILSQTVGNVMAPRSPLPTLPLQ